MMRTQTLAKPAPFNSIPSGILQRKCDCGANGAGIDQCPKCKAKKNRVALQRTASRSGDAVESYSLVEDVLNAPGQTLDAATRAFMEPRFGHDFSQIPVQNVDPQAKTESLTLGSAGDRFEQEAEIQANEAMLTTERPLNRKESQQRYHDFSQVRIHNDAKAAASAKSV